MERTRTLPHRIILTLLLAAILAALVLEASRYRQQQQQLDTQLRQTVERQSRQSATTLNQQIRQVEQAAEAFAATISEQNISQHGYLLELKAFIAKDPRFYGGTVAFEPFSFDAAQRLYAPYYARQGEQGELAYMQIEEAYDYTLPEQEWYYRAIREGSRWSEPYFDESVGNILMTTYSAVFYRTDATGNNKVPWGVVTVDLSMDTIGDGISALDTGINSYVELVTHRGTYLYSPDKNRVLQRKNIFEQEHLSGQNSQRLKQKVTSQDTAAFEMPSTGRGEQKPYYSVAPVTGAGWSLVTTYYDQAAKSNTTLRQAQMRLVLLSVLLGVLLLLLYYSIRHRNRATPWTCSMLIGMLFAAGVCNIWYNVASVGTGGDLSGLIITDAADRRNIERYYDEQAAQYLLDPPQFTSVGIYLESVKFASANDLRVTGIYWQKIPDTQPTTNPGINLLGVMDLKQKDPMITKINGYTLYRWAFQGQFHLALDNKHYPLVRDVLSLHFIPSERSGSVILLPDLASYRIMSPIAKPGLHESTFLTGWNIRRSYFDLTPWSRNSTFGLDNSIERLDAPILAYNIEVEKVFVDAFISTLTPLIIASMLIFTIFYITTTDDTKISFMRTGVSFELGFCTSIFFVVVMSHIGVRRSIVSEHIFYLEYFYFLMYLNLVMLCLYSVMQVRHNDRLHQLTFNIPPEKIFFPLNMALIYLFTFAVFYP